MASGDAPRLTTQQGIVVSDDQNTLRAGERGPSALEDFHFREKIYAVQLAAITGGTVTAASAAAEASALIFPERAGCMRPARVARRPAQTHPPRGPSPSSLRIEWRSSTFGCTWLGRQLLRRVLTPLGRSQDVGVSRRLVGHTRSPRA